MRNRPPINDPQTIWQSQGTEETKMSLTLFRLKAEQLRARARWMAIANGRNLRRSSRLSRIPTCQGPQHDIAYRTGPPGRRLLLRGLSSGQAAVAAIPGPGRAARYRSGSLPARVAAFARSLARRLANGGAADPRLPRRGSACHRSTLAEGVGESRDPDQRSAFLRVVRHLAGADLSGAKAQAPKH